MLSSRKYKRGGGQIKGWRKARRQNRGSKQLTAPQCQLTTPPKSVIWPRPSDEDFHKSLTLIATYPCHYSMKSLPNSSHLGKKERRKGKGWFCASTDSNPFSFISVQIQFSFPSKLASNPKEPDLNVFHPKCTGWKFEPNVYLGKILLSKHFYAIVICKIAQE